jgi:hypothetical protein
MAEARERRAEGATLKKLEQGYNVRVVAVNSGDFFERSGMKIMSPPRGDRT